MNFNKLKKNFGLKFIVLSAMIMLIILFKNDEIFTLLKVIKSINRNYILLALSFLFVFWFIEAAIIYALIIKFTNHKKDLKTFWLALKVTLIGQYYSNITPMATGGQPVQLYILKDEDISLSNGTAILICKFLLFQIGVTIYSFCLAVYKIKLLSIYYNNASIFVFIGLTLNIIMLTSILLIAFNQQLLLKLCESLFNFLHRIKIIKNTKKLMYKTEKFILEYKESIGKLKEDYWFAIKAFAVTFIQLTVYFSITFFIYKSLNLSDSSILEIISLQSFLYMAVSFIPTPGTAGASEVGFLMLFGRLFPSNIISTALLLWRGISYYFSLIFSGIFSFIITAVGKKNINLTVD